MNTRKKILFSGLFIFLLAGLGFALGLPAVICWMLLAGGIGLKMFFLFYTFRSPGFKMSAGMYMILTGVGLILLSMLFKTVYPFPLIRTILFYSAIALKISGVVLLFCNPNK
ncbi:MAG: hypothetical protein LUH15_02830 [Tannerellaceae bacterium]|nr:hypothetical protein [Tannerellaceae bacterium]